MATADDRLTGVRLADGSVIARQAVAVGARMTARAGFLADLGLKTSEHPGGMGAHIPADPGGRTEVPGVWAAGNVTDLGAQVGAAAAAGALAGAVINADLVEEETRRAVEAQAGEGAGPVRSAAGAGLAGLAGLDVLHDDHAQGARLQGVEDVREVAGVAEVVAGAELDRLAFRAGQDAAGAEDQVLHRAGGVRAGQVARARLGADPVDVAAGAGRARREHRRLVGVALGVHDDPLPARITRMSLLGGSMRRLSGTPSAVPRAHSVSRDGLPVPLSSWDSVDLAMPARLASSVSDRPARARSRRRDIETSGDDVGRGFCL